MAKTGWDAALKAAVKKRSRRGRAVAVEIIRQWADVGARGITSYHVSVKVAYRQALRLEARTEEGHQAFRSGNRRGRYQPPVPVDTAERRPHTRRPATARKQAPEEWTWRTATRRHPRELLIATTVRSSNGWLSAAEAARVCNVTPRQLIY